MAATPVAKPDFYTITQGAKLSVPAGQGVLVNDYDTDGSSLIAANFGQAAHGTVTLVTDGSFTYTPDAGFVGTDSFTYTNRTTGDQAGSTATVTIDVTAPLLVATDDTYKTSAGTKLTVNAASGLLANDLSVNGTLIAANFGQAAHGTVTLVTDGGFTYTPNAGFSGTDTFSYSDSNGVGTDSATVTIDVVEAAPVANPDSYAVRAGSKLIVAAARGVLANDQAFGGTLIAANFGQAAHGAVTLVIDGSFTYTPAAGFVGTDSFGYTDSDGTAQASSKVTINVVDTAPIANPDYYHAVQGTKLTVTAAEGLLANDGDPDGDMLIAQNFGQAAHGTVSLVTDGSFTYTPNAGFTGTDSFSYTLGDGTLTDPGTVSIDVVACYAAGTLIMTPHGPAPVEDFQAGDSVTTAVGASRPVRWIGRRSYAGRYLAAHPDVRPIRIRAGALGAGLPHRDLLVSPDHAMFIDGVLVPARCLVNGVTIQPDQSIREVHYFHVELESHDVILAEGAPSESFVDDGSRGTFHNLHEHEALFPGHVPAPAQYCAPRVSSGAALERIRHRLNAVAATVEWVEAA